MPLCAKKKSRVRWTRDFFSLSGELVLSGAAPLTDAVVKPQGPQAAAVHQGVIPHPLQGPGQGQVLQVPGLYLSD